MKIQLQKGWIYFLNNFLLCIEEFICKKTWFMQMNKTGVIWVFKYSLFALVYPLPHPLQMKRTTADTVIQQRLFTGKHTHTHTLLTTYLIKNNCKSLVLIRIRSASRLHLYDENKYYRFYVIYDNFKCSITSYFFKYLFLWLYCTSVAICIFIYFITLYNMLMTILFYSIV